MEGTLHLVQLHRQILPTQGLCVALKRLRVRREQIQKVVQILDNYQAKPQTLGICLMLPTDNFLTGVTILFGAKHTLRNEVASEAVLSMHN